MHTYISPVALAVALSLVPIATSASDLPVVVAVDTSRSLRPGDVEQAARLVRDALRSVEGGHGAVMSFDDEPRWVAPLGTPLEGLSAAVGDLVPRGDYTLLYDALFVAARELEEGGVVVVVTDGRDENSATTVEDVAAVCRERGVRLLTVGSGRRVQERALRRLALLTDGRYLGRLGDDAGASALAEAIRTARVAPPVEAVAPTPLLPAPVRADPAPPPAATGTDEPATDRRWMVWLGMLAALVIGAVAAIGIVRSRVVRAPSCSFCGSELTSADDDCSTCAANEIHARLRDRPVVSLEDTAEFDLMVEEGAGSGDPGVLETTRVLTDQSVLVIQEPGERPRNYLLRSHAAFGIGRDTEINTVALSDLALSSCHFKIVPEDGVYYVVDLDSTNGTFVNQERVRARPLSSGDVIHAGQVDFEFRSYTRPVF